MEINVENIKKFLSENELDNSLECLKAEIRSKSIARIMLNDQSQNFKIIQNSNKEINFEKYHKQDLLKSGRKLVSFSSNVLEKLEKFEDISELKLKLSRFHDIFYELEFKQGNLLENLQEIKANIYKSWADQDYDKLNLKLLELRTEALTIANHKRDDFIKNLVGNNIFSNHLKRFLDIDNLETKKTLLGLLSIFCSNKTGRSYILGNTPQILVKFLVESSQNSSSGSVSQRFSIACLEKLSYSEVITIQYMCQSHYIKWIIFDLLYCQIVNKMPSNSFIQIYGCSLLANLLNSDDGLSVINDTPNMETDLNYLLEILMENDLSLESLYPLLICISTISKELPDLNINKEIEGFVDQFRLRGVKDLELRSLVFTSCSNIIQKNTIVTQSSSDLEEILDFECFSDEITLN